MAELARAGDGEALGRLLDLVRPELELFLRLHRADRFRTRESVSDVAHSVCAECVAHLAAFAPRGPGSFRAWLRRLALHK